MSQAQAYVRTKNFLDNSGDRTDHAALNAELDNVSVSVQGLRENQALIQKDDGTLADGSVGFDQLTDEAKLGLAVPGPKGEDSVVPGPAGNDSVVPGPKGDVGASFVASTKGLAADRADFDNEDVGFSFLAMDTGMLYFKLSNVAANWSIGFIFGKGEKGDTGQGIQGLRGLQGFRGPPGTGLKGDTGDQGAPGVVDYSRVLRNDTVNAQTLQGSLTAASFATAQSMTAKIFVFYQQDTRVQVTGGRVTFTDDQSTPTVKGIRVADVISSGIGGLNTGYKLANGDDIATLFDPSGAATLKEVDTNPVVVNIAGKTNITLALQVIGSQIKLVASAS